LQETDGAVEVDTGEFVCRFPRSGTSVISSISQNGREALRDGQLVLLSQDLTSSSDDAQVSQSKFEGVVEKVTVEQRGPARAVVKVEGRHAHRDRPRHWLPFTLRFYFYAGNPNLRVLHTIVYDGDENKDFI